jgi:hypothetical protein
MIEALVKHIQDAGFTVYVLKGMLQIEKVVGSEVLHLNWAIDPVDLAFLLPEVLFEAADQRIQQMEQAIAAKEQGQ